MHNIIAAYLYQQLWTPRQQGRSGRITEPPRYFFNNPFWVSGHLFGACDYLWDKACGGARTLNPEEAFRSKVRPWAGMARSSHVLPRRESVSLGGQSLMGLLLTPGRATVERHAGPPRGSLVLIMTRSPSHAASATMSGVRVHVQGH